MQPTPPTRLPPARSGTSSRRGVRRAARRAAPVLLVLVALTGCSEAEDALGQARDEAEGAVREQAGRLTDGAVGDAVAERVRAELERAGVSLEARPQCDPDVDLSALEGSVAGRVDCTGRTTEGEDVVARFDGRFGVGSCEGELVVTVAGEERVRTPDLQVCG